MLACTGTTFPRGFQRIGIWPESLMAGPRSPSGSVSWGLGRLRRLRDDALHLVRTQPVRGMNDPSLLRVLFETHATSIDNEAGLASGSLDVALSSVGEEQARALGVRRQHDDLAVVFCSDLQRAFRTADIAFAARGLRVVRDPRLRGCD